MQKRTRPGSTKPAVLLDSKTSDPVGHGIADVMQAYLWALARSEKLAEGRQYHSGVTSKQTGGRGKRSMP
jgi:hypothetical protein